jgi:predicted RNase H-like nuclease (RuvC/YqgF family)
MSRLPPSPPEEPTPDSTSAAFTQPQGNAQPELVPLESVLRTTPIHPHLPEIRVPSAVPPLSTHHYHPVTCTPIDTSLSHFRSQLQQLRKEYPSATAALKAQEETVREVKQRMEDAIRKRSEVQKALDKKVKERDTELKVLSKYQEVKASELH